MECGIRFRRQMKAANTMRTCELDDDAGCAEGRSGEARSAISGGGDQREAAEMITGRR